VNPLLITLLAEEGPKNTGPDFGKASPVGLLVVVLLLIGVFALVWSMNRHLKRVPASFDAPEGGAVEGTSEPAGGASADNSETAPRTEPKGESGG
jgi:hypothetical protein